MKKRVISAAILLIILIPLIIIGKVPFRIAVGLVSLLGYYEIMKIYDYPFIVKILGFISLISIVYCNYDGNILGFGLDYRIISITLLITLIPIIFYQVKEKYTIEDAFKLYGFLFLIGIGLNYIILIREFDLKYFIFMILIPIFTDTFAYIGGSLIGKHKITELSKNKSLEGYLIGSIMGTFIMTMYYITVIDKSQNLFIIIGIIFILTIIGQIGDLFFSAIKRQYKIKDFSNLIPGHGGVLDRLDSQIFVAIAFIIFFKFL